MEIYIFEEEKYNLYVHHDILLSSFPIALEWFPIEPSSFGNAECDRANLAIVGSFLPDIEIWDLDILDSVEPRIVLRGSTGDSGNLPPNPDGHSNAVISLASNKIQRQVLASGSADGTVKLWDLSKGSVAMTHNCQGFKPESIAWHPAESSVLFMATDDNHIRAADVRAPKEVGKYKFETNVEQFSFEGSELHIAFGNGYFGGIDLVKGFEPSYSKKVCKKSVSSVAVSPGVPGLMCVSSMDSILRVYNSKDRDDNNCPIAVDRILTKGVSYKFNCKREICFLGLFTLILLGCTAAEAVQDN